MRRIIIFLELVIVYSLLFLQNCFARQDVVELFKNNQAIIYTINIRNFSALDYDNDGIIDIQKGEKPGTFLGAKEKLKDLKNEGINVIYLLPITQTGRLKALGTVGSLYAMDSFDKISDFLNDYDSDKSLNEQAKEFIDQAHDLGFNVIVDLPSCGSYDLTLKKPNWFMFKDNEAITPSDWTDVRLFKIYNDDNTLNSEMLDNFKKFVDMAQSLGFDGIRADVAAIKPYEFWKNIISYAKEKNNKFVFIAEASPEWSNPAPGSIKHYATTDELLNAGFDTYYAPFSNFSNIKTKKEFDEKIIKNTKILNKHKGKSSLSTFATHDQKAPVLRGENYWNMVLWLNVTLPYNAYFLDGFSVGDDFTYDYEGKSAKNTYSDDEYYFVHSGMFDIFNLTAQVRPKHPKLKKNYLKALNFRNTNSDLIAKGNFKLLKTNNEKVFAYSIINDNKELIAVGSLDENEAQKALVKSKLIKNNKYLFSFLNGKNKPKITKDEINCTLEPLEIQVYLFNRVAAQE